ncbi:MAG: nucleoside triphosphate pyrophosphohydrolase [Christensenellaceae bacterium]|jgi:predicted house-cleaning noncanonical NTP pyrophosphatase (MazG superfamily)
MEYHKLVRDKIPSIIEAEGYVPCTKVLSTEAYLLALKEKLQEEVAEYLADASLEELADILEVVYALAAATDHSIEALEEARALKHQTNGGFAEKIFLISKSK